MLNKLRGVAGVSPCERRFRTCACISIVSSLLCLYTHATAQETRPTQQTEALATVTNLTRPSPRPARDDARRRAILTYIVKLVASTAHACRITRREMRDVCRCALPLVHTSLARRVASGPPNPLVAARLHGSAPHARSASTHVDPCQHVKYPLVPVRFALTRHAACMLNAADQVGYPTTPRPSRRIGVPHIHTFPTFTPLPPLPLSEDTKARRPSRPPPTASPGRPPSLPHCQRP